MKEAIEKLGVRFPLCEGAEILNRERVRSFLPVRKRNSHKGTYGRTAIVAGSEKYTGAAGLSVMACLRSGVGYTTLFTPEQILPYYILKYPEALLEILNEGGRVAFNEENLQKLLAYDSVAIGMGMEDTFETGQCVEWLLRRYQGKLIIDADGLNALSKFPNNILKNLWAQKQCDVLITPHYKEFSRLTGEDAGNIQNDPISYATAYAKTHKLSVLLKGAVTVITDGESVFVNTAGTSAQAKGGSGDVLSGLIAGLCASGSSVLESGCAGAYLSGKAAEFATQETGEYSLLASDTARALCRAFLFVTEDSHAHGDEE